MVYKRFGPIIFSIDLKKNYDFARHLGMFFQLQCMLGLHSLNVKLAKIRH